MKAPESIKATDLVLLMDALMAAAGLYNALEKQGNPKWNGDWVVEFEELGEKLRALGIAEVTE